MEKKKYFVVLNHIEEHHNSDWTEKSVIQWAKEMAQQGHTAKVYSGELIKEFDVKINVIDKSKKNKGITSLFCVDEKDKCKGCNKKIWKENHIIKTKDGYLCDKCSKKKEVIINSSQATIL